MSQSCGLMSRQLTVPCWDSNPQLSDWESSKWTTIPRHLHLLVFKDGSLYRQECQWGRGSIYLYRGDYNILVVLFYVIEEAAGILLLFIFSFWFVVIIIIISLMVIVVIIIITINIVRSSSIIIIISSLLSSSSSLSIRPLFRGSASSYHVNCPFFINKFEKCVSSTENNSLIWTLMVQ